MKKSNWFGWVSLFVVAILWAGVRADLDSSFTASPLASRAHNWYWLHSDLDDAQTDFQLKALRDSCGFSGIVPCFDANNWFDTPNFTERFHHMIDKAAELGMSVCLNDDFYFPSGTARGKTPWDIDSRVLNKYEQDVSGPATFQKALPAGTNPAGTDDIFMGCVAMSNTDHSILHDLSAYITGNSVTWSVPAGSWKIMIFSTNHGWTGTNFLSKPAVEKWISLTYQRFYDLLPEHFGTTIHSMFFDDIGSKSNGWIDDFNAKFQAQYGFSPVKFYPAMWYDIGSNTAAARNMLYGFRNDQFSRCFGETVSAWCTAHKVESSGHYASTANTNSWISAAGDPIKFFKYVHRIGTEGWRNMSVSYKIPSSAGYLYDKPLVVNQNYALLWDFTVEDMWRMGMESFANGITTTYADGAQNSDPVDESFMRPELSWRNTLLAPMLPDLTKWTGRCQMLLEGGRHVADIALLFPIASYTGECYFGHESGTSDFVAVADTLSHHIRRDYTFMHPEVLDSNCTVDAVNHTINLNNKVNYERYKVFIIPGSGASGAIHASTIRKAKEFYDKGGIIVCTSNLPWKSAELGQDSVVVNGVMDIFGLPAQNPGTAYKKNTNANGGKAYFIKDIAENVNGIGRLQWVLDDAVAVWDVECSPVSPALNQPHIFPFSYLHKVKNNVDYYFFANSSSQTITSQVRLRGRITPQMMDPHTGAITSFANGQFQNITDNGQDVTVVRVALGPVKSLFIRNSTPTELNGTLRNARVENNLDVKVVLKNFWNSTTLLTSIPLSCRDGLQMKLFGADGRLIRSLKNSSRVPGSRTIYFIDNGAPLPAGAYVCRIHANGFTKTLGIALRK